LASISGINVNSVFIVEILLEKGADIKDMLFYRYRLPKRISFYTDVSGSIAEAVITIAANIVRALNMFIIIYTMSIYL